MKKSRNRLGIIVGSVLNDDDQGARRARKERVVETPYGVVSLVEQVVAGSRVLVASRHGFGHEIPPHEVNYRAIVAALKMLQTTHVLGVCAVGSLREDFRPGDLVVPDQFLDRTYGREQTFFGNGLVGHIQFADPVCPRLAEATHRAAVGAIGRGGDRVTHMGAKLAVIQGPRFGTRADGQALRAKGADIVGMTAMPEAALAREGELCYASISLVTDFDAGSGEVPPVSQEMVRQSVREHGEIVRRVIIRLVGDLPHRRCGCGRALDGAIATRRERIGGGYWKNPVFAGYLQRSEKRGDGGE